MDMSPNHQNPQKPNLMPSPYGPDYREYRSEYRPEYRSEYRNGFPQPGQPQPGQPQTPHSALGQVIHSTHLNSPSHSPLNSHPNLGPGLQLNSSPGQVPSSPVTPSANPWSPHGTPYSRARVSPVRKGHYNVAVGPMGPGGAGGPMGAGAVGSPSMSYWNTSLHSQSQPQMQPQTQMAAQPQLQPIASPRSSQPITSPRSSQSIASPIRRASAAPIRASIPPPTFRSVQIPSDLNPQIVQRPQNRRALPEGGYMSPLMCLTLHLSSTYQICNSGFNYESSKNPRRVLTKPSEPKLNNGHDNRDNDYILYVNDVLGTDENKRYLVLDILGQGTFGQVVKCQNMKNKEIVAVKVIKNNPAFLNQSMMEVSILEYLNNSVDDKDEHHILRLKDKFLHKQHYCLVFELLSSNLYELLKQNQFRGLSINLVRVFSRQLLDSLTVLKNAKLIHCDLKPENILLKSLDSPVIKVIDFGSACHERKTVYTYIQSRFYRSPEVLLGIPYTSSIDMWSVGCIIAELFLGLPIFPGASEYNQLCRIVASLGNPPNWMVEMGKNSGKFIEKLVDEHGLKRYRLKSRERYSREFNVDEKESKQYFSSTDLRTIIMNYHLPKKNMKKAEIDKEFQNREALCDFLMGLLNYNPFERWTPQQAASHPFITESKYTGPFVPLPKDEKDVFHPTTDFQPTPTAQPISQTHPLHAQGSQYGTWTGLTKDHTGNRRPRAMTYGSIDPIPPPIQRATAMVNPADHIQAQPSPAYVPPELGDANDYGDVVRNLEKGLMRW